ncbi:MAG: peptidoglycan DD-metalloendopeptidase family protein [Calditrichaeota bacterium]|nr:peptidoglycan DD-metalloendopeptidase family protein [Calditrichota bacterium]MCB0267142.1 peptidoglycan DD-metalloendopeptidase family protein [Calditrichota bacterium]MCB0287381.1 peptidoglycan DD-metalloendopeptidase family protein [Calditrichota bacterium]MCB0300824.1 peptidoglycan DD-metalloendopeptidase family protein [Calditrichota bacterium]MCB9066413.1 peptidoglycan DD-metalloendopeptidase family protein [Calditrichia bacterium]
MHKKDKKKYLNILLVPDNQEAPPKSFRLKYSTLNFIVVFLAVALVSVVFGIVTYSRVLQAALEKAERENELTQLREQLKVGYELQAQLDTIKAYKDKVRNSLQGYIKFAERAREQSYDPETLVETQAKATLLTTLPLKSPVVGFVSQEFRWPEHPGLDIVAKEGVPIQAAGDGKVLFSGWTNDFGYSIILYHPGGYLTYYSHNSQNLVSIHQEVSQGDVIGLVGNSGISSGPHLHFEIWKNGKPQNPRLYLMDLNNLGE